MESVPFTGEPEGHEFQQILASFDAPAFIRRARGVQDALGHLLAKCLAQRDDWLKMTRLLVGRLHALTAGDWSVLRPLLADDEQVCALESLHTNLASKLRVAPPPTTSARVLRRTLGELVKGLEQFNARWQPYLEKVDCGTINELRERYNRYYVLEKACALRSDRLARIGFEPMVPLTVGELAEHLPLLIVPRLAER
jgi:hypothetical protein